MVAGEFGVNAFVKFAVAGPAGIERLKAAVIFGQLLLDDISLDSDADMVGLAGEVCGDMEVLVLFEGVVP